MVVHSALPQRLEAAVDEALGAASVAHVAHGDRDSMAAAEAAAGDDSAQALIGPFLSRAVAHAVEAEEARRAARLIVDALRAGATDRPALLRALRAAGPFDEHGDPVDPPVWLWEAGPDWVLRPARAL